MRLHRKVHGPPPGGRGSRSTGRARTDALARVAALALCVAAGGCASAAPQLVHLRDAPRRPSLDPAWIQTYEGAAAVAMAIMEAELGIPRLDVALHVLPDSAALRRALIDAGQETTFAGRTAGLMDAITSYGRIWFNRSAFEGTAWPIRTGVVAHELTHALQYELAAGRRGTSEQWLREGFADWVTGRVLAALEVMPAREFAAARRRQHGSARGRLPGLSELLTFDDWAAALSAGDAPEPVIARAFLAADFLVNRHGAAGVLDYFSRFATSDDRQANFAAAFGELPGAFEKAFDDYVRALR